jgi:hypothetical protein
LFGAGHGSYGSYGSYGLVFTLRSPRSLLSPGRKLRS